MIDEDLARLRAHRNNIHRYRRLLKTRLTDLERNYIETRLKEEEAAVHKLSPLLSQCLRCPRPAAA